MKKITQMLGYIYNKDLSLERHNRIIWNYIIFYCDIDHTTSSELQNIYSHRKNAADDILTCLIKSKFESQDLSFFKVTLLH
jgi:hypothetical protein